MTHPRILAARSINPRALVLALLIPACARQPESPPIPPQPPTASLPSPPGRVLSDFGRDEPPCGETVTLKGFADDPVPRTEPPRTYRMNPERGTPIVVQIMSRALTPTPGSRLLVTGVRDWLFVDYAANTGWRVFTETMGAFREISRVPAP